MQACKEVAETNVEKVKPVSHDSEGIVYKRFERDLSQVYEHYEVTDESMVSKERAQEILLQMGFIAEGSELDNA